MTRSSRETRFETGSRLREVPVLEVTLGPSTPFGGSPSSLWGLESITKSDLCDYTLSCPLSVRKGVILISEDWTKGDVTVKEVV